MPTKMRLQRRGKKGQPFYHIVIADGRAPRDGKFIEKIGYYNPITRPTEIVIDIDKAIEWLGNGAQPTDTVRSLLSFKGILYKYHLLKGVRKGALTEEQAEAKFQTWVKEKEEKIAAKAQKTDEELRAEKKARLKAEEEIKEKRAKELAARRVEEEEAEASAEETEEAAEGEVTEVQDQQPAEEKPAEEEKKEEPKAEEVKEEEKKEEPKAEEKKEEEKPAEEEKKEEPKAEEKKEEEKPAEEEKKEEPKAEEKKEDKKD